MILPTVDECISNLSNEFDVVEILVCDGLSTVDLYIKINRLFREYYENNQRIIFLITQDTSRPHAPGQTLQNLQAIINDIDISNFFVCIVTTNPEIKKDYQYVFDNISRDPVPFNIYPCKGEYKKLISDDIDIYSKIKSLKSQIDHIKNLTPTQKKLVFENKSFCMLAWAGINVEPDGRTRPCCEFQGTMGNASNSSLNEIWKSESWKKIRKNMLDNDPIQECSYCYEKEKKGRDTLRKTANRLLIDKINLVDQTRDDGSLDVFNLSYWDIRYNNLCNLSCRSCNPGASSSWYQPAIDIGLLKKPAQPILIAGRKNNDIFEQIMQHIDHVKQIYFAGGEPSMIAEFYDILELLDKAKKHDVNLCYNLNMSRLDLKNKSLLELWKKFPKVSVGASLDGEGARGEYLRQGLVWQDVVDNRRKLINQCLHVDFYINATVSILNVLHLPDFHRSWVDQNLIKPEDFNIHLLYKPSYLNIARCPAEMKLKIQEVYNKHLKWLMPLDSLGRATFGFQSVLSIIENHIEFDPVDFWSKINSLDRYHQTEMLQTFPALDFLPRY